MSTPVVKTLAPETPLTISAGTLAPAIDGMPYSVALNANGGTPAYSWSVSAGSLPAGLALGATTGTITGTATTAGTANFSIAVSDHSNPVQTKSAAISVTVVPRLEITQAAIPAGQVDAAYSASLQATGGTAGYQWSLTGGAMPAGLNLNASTGAISGTPTTAGTYGFTVAVSDSGTPVQSQSAAVSVVVAAATSTAPNNGTTWYVRADGGSRYSTNMPQGQCNGKADAAYPGTGTNQACAFNDARYLWQDGSYTVTSAQSAFPSYGWIGAGGDTYIIRGSLGTGVSWRVGYPNNSDPYDTASQHYWGVAGDPYGSGAPPPLSGTASQHTRILGENYGACHTASAKTQLHGGYGVGVVLNMTGTSYVDVACLDITDFSSCGRASQTNTCNSTLGQLADYAGNGIQWSRTSTNDTLTDVHIHGMASSGMLGPTGNGVAMDYVDVMGNAGSGWNADAGDGTTGTGSLLVQHYNVSWNGCAEEYPVVDALPYQDCTDDNTGGYGDGFGTASVSSTPGWNVTFDQGVVSYNTQDGLDALHLTGSGSSMTVTRTQAYGNMGQQIKVGSPLAKAVNNLIVTNCNALRQAIPGTPSGYNSRLSDYCRAADTGIVLTLSANTRLTFNFNTIYSASATGIEIDCDTTDGACNASSTVDFRNNIFLGFQNNKANGYPGGGSGNYSNPIYNGTGINFFANSGSVYANNITFHPSTSWSCPAANETNGICGDPNLADESWHLYGVGSMAPNASSVAMRSGVQIATVPIDYVGVERPYDPTIGALEQ